MSRKHTKESWIIIMIFLVHLVDFDLLVIL